MDKRVLVIAIALAVGASGFGAWTLLDGKSGSGSDGGGGPSAAAEAVTADNRAFAPRTIVVSRGRTLRFTNEDDEAHTFTADGGVFHSGVLQPGETYEVTLGSTQNVRYHCEIHPGMQGTVEVR